MNLIYVCDFCAKQYESEKNALSCEEAHRQAEINRKEAFERLPIGTKIKYFSSPDSIVSGEVIAHFETKVIIRTEWGYIDRLEAHQAIVHAETINGSPV